METLYGLYVEGSESGSLAAFLMAEGATRASSSDNPCYWYVPSVARTRVREWLEDRSVNFVPTYEFSADPADAIDDLAAHLGIRMLTQLSVVPSSPLIAKDPDDFRIVANRPMLELLEPITRGIEWSPYERLADFSFILSATELPDPVELPKAFNIERLGTGLWDVSGDGRSIITQRNLEHLKQVGISYSTAYSVDGNTYPRKNFPVFGGRVVQVAKQAGVDIVVYLPHEGIEIESW
ncbi:hypothetical protein ACWELB_11560 [Streptomyces asiaticus]|uniref:hypothetical protein n=1 Tax=Streptomyces asiaticus TaxID=114695 RepID=UPI003D74FB6F